MLNRRTYVGSCIECGASLFYNEQEEKLVSKGGDPDCLHHYDWPEDREEELVDIVLPLNYAKDKEKEGEKDGETDN